MASNPRVTNNRQRFASEDFLVGFAAAGGRASLDLGTYHFAAIEGSKLDATPIGAVSSAATPSDASSALPDFGLSTADDGSFALPRLFAGADDFGSSLGAANLGSVTVGGSTNGNIEMGGDRDWFAVTLAANQSYIIRVISTSALDPSFALLDSNGIAVGGNDDFAGDGANSRLNFTAPVGGTYYINAGSPFGSGADSIGSYTVSVAINPTPPTPPTDDFGAQTGAPNLGSVTAGGASVSGTINFDGDRDWFAITLTAGQAYIFTQNRTSPADSIDPQLFLRDSIGNVLTSDDEGGGAPNARIAFTASVTGTYYLDATSFQGSGTGAYTINAAFDGAPPPPPVDDFGSQIGAANLGSLTVGGGAVTGNIEVGGDHDWFAVTLVAGGLYRFNHNRVTIEDPRFSLRNSAGTIIGGNDDFAPPNVNAQLDFTAPTSGVYYLDANSPFNDNTGTYTVSVTQLNTAPTLGTNAGLALDEGATGTITAARLDYNDIEQADSAITYTVTSAATNGTLFRNGVALALNGTFTQADVNTNLITYTHNGGETTSASFGFSVSDGAGGTLAGQSFAFNVTPVDDAPMLTATATNPTYTENSGPASDLFSSVTASTVETGQTFTGMTITVTNVTGGANERILVDSTAIELTNGFSILTFNNLTVNVSVVGTTATVSFSGANLSSAQLVGIVDGLNYRHLGDTPVDGNRVVTITQLVDSGSNTAPNSNTATLALSSTVNVDPVNDAPTLTGLPLNFQLTRNTTLPLDYSSVTVGDVDNSSLTVTIQTSGFGVFSGAAMAGVTVGGSESTLTLTGAASALNSYFDIISNISYAPPLNFAGAAINVFFLVSDGLTAASGQSGSVVVAPVLLTTPGVAVTENFNALENTGALERQLLLPGWSLNETGTSPSNTETYRVGDGNSNAGDVYSFGIAAGATDRALGTLLSGTLAPTIGVAFTNNTGATITALQIAYTGEQWRLGTTGRADRLDFQTSTNATALTNGTWDDHDNLDFTAPVTVGTVGALDGNAAANRTIFNLPITNISIAPGATFWIRWVDFNATGSDDGLAIDDFSITAFTNTLPVVDLDNVTVGNDAAVSYTENNVAVSIAPFADVTDADAGDQIVSAVVTLTDPQTGDTLAVDGTLPGGITAIVTATTVTLSGAATPADYAAALRLVTFASSSDDPTGVSATRSFTVTVNDGDSNSVSRTSVVTITPTNDAPSGTDATLTIAEDTPRVLTVADFGFTDPDSGNALAGVLITTLPTAGTLTYNGLGVTANQAFLVADLPFLAFTPAPNANGTGYSSFTFQVIDDGGNANGGQDTDSTPNTITFNVTPVNDSPVVPDGPTVTTNEQTAVTVLPAINVSDVDLDARNGGNGDYAGASFQINRNGAPNAEDSFGFASSALFTVNGNALQAGGLTFATVVAAGGVLNIGFTSTGTAATSALVDAVLQGIEYLNGSNEPAASVSLTYGLFDGAPGGGQGSGAPIFDGGSVTVNLNSVNDAPSGTDATITTNEDVARLLTVADFGFTDVDGDTFASVTITGVTGGVLLVDDGDAGTPVASVTSGTFTAAQLDAGFVTFQPTVNLNGTGTGSITFQVIDNGGTANGGVDTDPSANVLSIDIVSVNDAPSGTSTTVTGSEDDPYVFTLADFGFSDVDGNGFDAVVITTLPGDGTLVLTNSEAPFAGQAISVSDIAAGNLRFIPDADEFGSPYDSFTFQVRDNGGTANGGVNTDPTPNTITINVTPDNTPPFDLRIGSGGTIEERADPGTVAATFAASDNDVGDELTFTLIDDAGGRFAISAAGVLTATSVETDFETAVSHQVTVRVTDRLGAFVEGSFTIAIADVFDPAVIFGTPQEDELVGTRFADAIIALEDDDVVFAGAGNDSVLGGAGNDIIFGEAGGDTLVGDAGDDILDGGAGAANTLIGGTANDIYIVSAIGDSVIEERLGGFDEVRTALSVFVLPAEVEYLTYTGTGSFAGLGNDLNNILTGGTGFDALSGGAGGDTLIGGSGVANELAGGLGEDTYFVSAIGDTVFEFFGHGVDTVVTALNALVLAPNVENLTFTGTTLSAGTGNDLANVMRLGVGGGSLAGLGGNDTLVSGPSGGAELVGGAGNDIYVVTTRTDTIIEAAGEGIDEVRTTTAVFELGADLENLTFTGTGTFAGIGNGAANRITGGAGNDTLSGFGGTDTLIGGMGNDLLFGGADSDTLTGGGGADDFFFAGNESGIDTITDFTSGSDRIFVNRSVFGGGATFTLVTGGGPVPTTGGSTFLFDTVTGLLRYDADGTGAGAAVSLATLGAGATLTAGDLVLYDGAAGAGQAAQSGVADAAVAFDAFGSDVRQVSVLVDQLFY